MLSQDHTAARWQSQNRMRVFDSWWHFFLFIFLFLSIWLFQVLVAACGMISVATGRIFSYGTWDLVPWPRIEPKPPALGAWCLNGWTTREGPTVGTSNWHPDPGIYLAWPLNVNRCFPSLLLHKCSERLNKQDLPEAAQGGWSPAPSLMLTQRLKNSRLGCSWGWGRHQSAKIMGQVDT